MNKGFRVYLNLYDLSPANDFLWPIGLGLHHSGIEILGTEYSFASGAGVFEMPPKQAPGAKFREQMELGLFSGSQADLNRALDEVRERFGPNDYNLIRKNCNHYARAVSWKLLGKDIPGYVNRLADIGTCCSYLIPRPMLENAPVGDPSAPTRNTMARDSVKAFAGSGNVLGSSSSEQERTGLLSRLGRGSSTAAVAPNDATDRREKARKAALARLEMTAKQGDDKSA